MINLGIAYQQNGNDKEAKEMYKKILDLEPNLDFIKVKLKELE